MSKFLSRISLIGSTFLATQLAMAGSFPMMKVGEWKVETVESSLGPLAQAYQPKPFCVDKVMDEKMWEERAKDGMKKSGMDCQLKQLKQDSTQIAYEAHCKSIPAAAGKKPVLPPDALVDGQLNLRKVSDTVYEMDQSMKGKGISIPNVDVSKIPPAQLKMLESALGIKNGEMDLKLKQKYVFLQATCSKK